MRARTFLLALSLAITPAGSALAEGGDAAAATALFQEGREAAKKGDYATACLKMEESYRLDAAPGTLLNLADCHEHLGHLATAWQRFSEATEKLPPADDRLPSVKARVAALAARLPRLTISLAPGAPAGTRVTRDGKVIGPGSLGTALPLDPGLHVVVGSAPDREDVRYPVDVAEGRSENVVVSFGAPRKAGGAPPAEPPRAEPGGRPLVLAGAVIGGLGVVTLVAAIGTGLALPSKGTTVAQNCGAAVHLGADQCNAVGFAAARSGQTLATANTATWIAGGVAAAAGVALVIVGATRGNKRAPPVEVAAAASLGGARIEGRFR